MALRQVIVPYMYGYSYGIGADLASGSPMGMVVTGAQSAINVAGGSTTSFEITRIHSTSDLESSLGIDVEASYGCASFGAGVSARFNYAKRSKIQSNSLFIAVTATVKLPFIQIDAPVLAESAKLLVNRHQEFESRYGNMFVRGIGRGGMFVGVLRIDSQSSEESESISAEVEGSYGLFSAEAETKFDTIQRKYNSEISIKCYHEGGPINSVPEDLQNPLDLYKVLKDWLTSFQTNPNENSVAYYVTLAPISIADAPIPPNIADIQKAQDIIIMCARQRSQILDNINLLDYISHNSNKFDFVAPTTVATLNACLSGYQSDLDLVGDCASNAINNITNAKTPAGFAADNQIVYPKGTLPDPMPVLKPGVPEPIVLPDFINKPYDEVYAWASSVGIELYDLLDSQFEILRALTHGYTNQDGIEEFHPHSPDQIVIVKQIPAGGTTIEPRGFRLGIDIDTAPGVPR